MDRVKNFTTGQITSLKSKSGLNDNQLLIILIAIVAIIVIGLIAYYINYRNWKAENPTFYTNPKDSKEKKTIKAVKLYEPKNGYDFSYSFWLSINNWNYRNRLAKHVFTKGRNDFRMHSNSPVCPAVFLDNNVNDLIFHINTGRVKKIRLEDVPLKKWFHVALVCRGKTVDLYLDGKINKTVPLPNYPKMNYGDLYVNHHGGYDGSLASLMYSPTAMNPKQITNLYNAGPDGQSWLFKQVKKIGQYLGVVESKKASSGGCGIAKVSTKDSTELTLKEEQLLAAKEALKLAQQKKTELSTEINALKKQESIERENKIRTNFNKLDTDKNKNISYGEFKKYSTN